MLARPGSVALQQWYAGKFPYTHTPINMRFIEATPNPPIGAAPAGQQQSPDLGAVLNEMRLMREENQSMFKAMSQRSNLQLHIHPGMIGHMKHDITNF